MRAARSPIRSCPPAFAGVCDVVMNHQLASPQRDPNTQEFVGEYNGCATSGRFICSAVSWDIIVPRNQNDMYMIALCHLIQVFSAAVDRPKVHHIGALIATRLSESLVMFPLGIFESHLRLEYAVKIR